MKKTYFAIMLLLASVILTACAGDRAEQNTESEISIIRGQKLNSEEIQALPFGEEISSCLDDIGATDINEYICEVDGAYNSYSFKITGGKANLWLSVCQSISSDGWYVKWIKDYDSHIYYYSYMEEWESQQNDIYSYETGEIISKAEVTSNNSNVDEDDIVFAFQEDYPENTGGTEKEVSSEAELILMTIAEDIAKQVAQNPETVKFKTFYWGFARTGHIYAVQGTFECSNLMGVTEAHDIQVWCKANQDYSKIQAYSAYLDGEKIA